MPKTAAIQAQETLQETLHDKAEERQRVRRQMELSQEEYEHNQANLRRFLYGDVETLINVGFISHDVWIGSYPISLRSLSPGDVTMLRHRCGFPVNDRTWKSWMVASSVWMVNGMNLLEDSAAPVMVHEQVMHLPKVTLDILFSIVMGLFNRVSKALTRTEAYCYEHYSRANWRLCGRQIPAQDMITGIPGTSRLGMNHIQRMWLAFNLAEDDREQHLREWQMAKLLASTMAPKGIKKLNKSDESIRKREERRRRDAILHMCQMTVWGEASTPEDESWTVMVRGEPVNVRPVKTALTDEELQEQFRAWVAGEKDWHDIVVDTYKERVRRHFEGERREREGVFREAAGVDAETQLVGYTLEELQELQRDDSDRPMGARRVFDGGASHALFEKYIAEDPSSGRLRADADGVYEVEPGELQEQVASRRPVISSEPIGSPPVRGDD